MAARDESLRFRSAGVEQVGERRKPEGGGVVGHIMEGWLLFVPRDELPLRVEIDRVVWRRGPYGLRRAAGNRRAFRRRRGFRRLGPLGTGRLGGSRGRRAAGRAWGFRTKLH